MQVCTYSEFNFNGLKNSFNALRNIGLGDKLFEGVAGLEFAKPMGTGSGNGFSIVPNLRRYTFFMVWQDAESARAFFQKGPLMQWYRNTAHAYLHVTLTATKVHGLWNGAVPLRSVPNASLEGQLAVLTRATIKPKFLPEFWLNVPDVSSFMAAAPGLMHHMGVGEYPLFMQATFSMWQSKEALYSAAYKDTAHAEVVKKTRQRGWYAEEMFAQFAVEAIESKGERYSHLAKDDAI
jgi:hypothetical protein